MASPPLVVTYPSGSLSSQSITFDSIFIQTGELLSTTGQIVGGTLVILPEPSTFLLVALGLAGLVGAPTWAPW